MQQHPWFSQSIAEQHRNDLSAAATAHRLRHAPTARGGPDRNQRVPAMRQPADLPGRRPHRRPAPRAVALRLGKHG